MKAIIAFVFALGLAFPTSADVYKTAADRYSFCAGLYWLFSQLESPDKELFRLKSKVARNIAEKMIGQTLSEPGYVDEKIRSMVISIKNTVTEDEIDAFANECHVMVLNQDEYLDWLRQQEMK